MPTMRILPDDFPKSGYQSQPAAPPSAGRALSVLIAVCAVLWVLWLVPEWYVSGTGDWRGYDKLLGIVCCTLAAAPVWSSYIVWRWATQLMWRAEPMQVEFKRGLVLSLCLMFHLLMLLLGCALAWLLVVVMN